MADHYTIVHRTDTAMAGIQGFDQPDAKVVYFHNAVMVLKVPGHKYWTQLPPDSMSYAPAEFQVYMIESTQDVGLIQRHRATRLCQFPVREEK